MRDYSMEDAAMHSGISDINMQEDSGMQDAITQDARPDFIAAAIAGLENSASFQSMTSPNDSAFEGWMAMIGNRMNFVDMERDSVGNKKVKAPTPTSRQNESDQVPLDEAEVEHAFAYAWARSRETDDYDEMMVAVLTAAFEEDDTAFEVGIVPIVA
jgi:hypothetical protein